MRLMAIGAHSDDAELACGGALAKAVENGDQARLVILTDSSYKSLKGKVLRTPSQAMRETMDAARILGIKEKDVRVLKFPTRELEYSAKTICGIENEIEEFKPDVILAHWPFDTHQDHRRAALSTISAGRRYNSILMYEPIMPAGRSYVAFRPQIYVDISDVIKKKLEALRRHKSQYQKYGEEWIEAVESRCRLRGFEISCKYAEAFEAARFEWRFDGRDARKP